MDSAEHVYTITEEPYACLNVSCSCGWSHRFAYDDNIVIQPKLRDHEVEPWATYTAEVDMIAGGDTRRIDRSSAQTVSPTPPGGQR